MKTKRRIPPIPPVAICRQLLSLINDPELCLAWKLGFHYFVSSAEAERLRAEDVVWRSNLPKSISIKCHNESRSCDWFVPIKTEDQLPLANLLPKEGPLFVSKDPYGRLVRFAAGHGIRLERKSIRRACLSYSMASGFYHDRVGELAGVKPLSWLRHSHRPVSQTEARKYWELSVSPADAAQLPRRLRRKHLSSKL